MFKNISRDLEKDIMRTCQARLPNCGAHFGARIAVVSGANNCIVQDTCELRTKYFA